MSEKNSIQQFVYDLNQAGAELTLDIPWVGEFLNGAQKFTCDWVIDPLTIGGTHVGCDAVNDVYNAHHGLPAQPPSDEQLGK